MRDAMREPTLESRIRRAGDVVFRELDGDTVLLDLKRGTCFTLDPVGTRIWQLLGESGPLSDIIATLVREFDVEESTAARDLLGVINDLAAQGLVSPED